MKEEKKKNIIYKNRTKKKQTNETNTYVFYRHCAPTIKQLNICCTEKNKTFFDLFFQKKKKKDKIK